MRRMAGKKTGKTSSRNLIKSIIVRCSSRKGKAESYPWMMTKKVYAIMELNDEFTFPSKILSLGQGCKPCSLSILNCVLYQGSKFQVFDKYQLANISSTTKILIIFAYNKHASKSHWCNQASLLLNYLSWKYASQMQVKLDPRPLATGKRFYQFGIVTP